MPLVVSIKLSAAISEICLRSNLPVTIDNVILSIVIKYDPGWLWDTHTFVKLLNLVGGFARESMAVLVHLQVC